MPSADFCPAGRPPFDSLSRRSDTEQISWGKLSRLPCTAAGSTLRAFDGYGLRTGDVRDDCFEAGLGRREAGAHPLAGHVFPNSIKVSMIIHATISGLPPLGL